MGYLLCPDFLLRSLLLPNLYHFGCYRKNNYKKIHLSTCCWDGQIFSHQFLTVSDSPPLLGRNCSLTLKSCSYCSLMEDALKLSFKGKLTIFTSHQVKQFLNGRGCLWMSDQRILRYLVLMENPGLAIYHCEILNPATLLPTPKGSLPFHSCLKTSGH